MTMPTNLSNLRLSLPGLFGPHNAQPASVPAPRTQTQHTPLERAALCKPLETLLRAPQNPSFWASFTHTLQTLNLSPERIPIIDRVLTLCNIPNTTRTLQPAWLQHPKAHRHLIQLARSVHITTPSQFRTLAVSPNLSLTHIKASFVPWTPDALRTLHTSASTLQSLSLTHHTLRDEHVTDILQTPLPNLRTLDLSYNGLTHTTARTIAATFHLPEMTSLSCAGNQLRDRDALTILESSQLTSLQHLDLSQNLITPRGVHSFASSLSVARLRSLSIHGPLVGAHHTQTLLQSPYIHRDIRTALSSP